ncbi:Gp138 family membrane-puncturing spike protein [Azospirillum argentinense]
MDPRERLDDGQEALRAAMDGLQGRINTAIPGIVVSFNAAALTAVVQPAIQRQVRDQTGAWHWVSLPLLLDCPVHFPSGGGFTLTFPVAPGDEVLAVIADRCIDAWWSSGGVQAQAELRMHDLSDGFVIPKVWSRPRAIGGVSTDSTQLRSDDGETYVEVAGGQVVTVKAPVGIVLDSPVVSVSGRLAVLNSEGAANPCTIAGTVQATGDVVAGAGGSSVSLQSHIHGGVEPGSGSTAAPTPGT